MCCFELQVNLTQAATQKAAEMKEKLKILSNEVDILRREIQAKDRELLKMHQESSAALTLKDGQRSETNKVFAEYKSKRETVDQNLAQIEAFNVIITATEQNMHTHRLQYEKAIKERNQLGLQLLDRNDELCILCEKFNAQENVHQAGEKALVEANDEIKQLSLAIQELNRQIHVLRTSVPICNEMTEQLRMLRKELEELRSQNAETSHIVESPDQRSRNLKGVDPELKAQIEKMQALEERLAEKEEQLMEKELILQEVVALTERLKKQTSEERTESLSINTKVNDLNKKIKNVTKNMMAKISELSMHRSQAEQLLLEKQEKVYREILIFIKFRCEVVQV